MSRPDSGHHPTQRPAPAPCAPVPASGPVIAPSFTVVRRRGRGWIDEQQVRGYVEAVRREHAAQQRRIAALTDQTHRLKQALADWQSRQAATSTDDGYLSPPRPLRQHQAPRPRHDWDAPGGEQPRWPDNPG